MCVFFATDLLIKITKALRYFRGGEITLETLQRLTTSFVAFLAEILPSSG